MQVTPIVVATAINNAPDAAAPPWPTVWMGVTMLVMLAGLPFLFRSDVPFDKAPQHYDVWCGSIFAIGSGATFLIYLLSRAVG